MPPMENQRQRQRSVDQGHHRPNEPQRENPFWIDRLEGLKGHDPRRKYHTAGRHDGTQQGGQGLFFSHQGQHCLCSDGLYD